MGNRYHGGSWFLKLGGKLIVEIKKEVNKMEWQMVVALVIAIPVILFPVAFVWYLNIGGIIQAVRKTAAAREKKAAVIAK